MGHTYYESCFASGLHKIYERLMKYYLWLEERPHQDFLEIALFGPTPCGIGGIHPL